MNLVKWMNVVQHNNLFAMSVGEEGDWLRYYPLFLEFLQMQIFCERPEEARELKKAWHWSVFKTMNGDRAFTIYRRLDVAEDFLVKLIETAEPDIVTGGRISTLSAWIDALPVEILNTRPFIIALQGYIAMALGDNSLALSLYNQAIGIMQLPQDRIHLARNAFHACQTILPQRPIG